MHAHGLILGATSLRNASLPTLAVLSSTQWIARQAIVGDAGSVANPGWDNEVSSPVEDTGRLYIRINALPEPVDLNPGQWGYRAWAEGADGANAVAIGEAPASTPIRLTVGARVAVSSSGSGLLGARPRVQVYRRVGATETAAASWVAASEPRTAEVALAAPTLTADDWTATAVASGVGVGRVFVPAVNALAGAEFLAWSISETPATLTEEHWTAPLGGFGEAVLDDEDALLGWLLDVPGAAGATVSLAVVYASPGSAASAPSAERSVTLADVPAAPTVDEVTVAPLTTPDGRSVRLTFIGPVAAAPAQTEWRVRYSQDAGSTWSDPGDVGVGASGYTLTVATAATATVVEIAAVSPYGVSTYYAAASVTPVVGGSAGTFSLVANKTTAPTLSTIFFSPDMSELAAVAAAFGLSVTEFYEMAVGEWTYSTAPAEAYSYDRLPAISPWRGITAEKSFSNLGAHFYVSAGEHTVQCTYRYLDQVIVSEPLTVTVTERVIAQANTYLVDPAGDFTTDAPASDVGKRFTSLDAAQAAIEDQNNAVLLIREGSVCPVGRLARPGSGNIGSGGGGQFIVATYGASGIGRGVATVDISEEDDGRAASVGKWSLLSPYVDVIADTSGLASIDLGVAAAANIRTYVEGVLSDPARVTRTFVDGTDRLAFDPVIAEGDRLIVIEVRSSDGFEYLRQGSGVGIWQADRCDSTLLCGIEATGNYRADAPGTFDGIDLATMEHSAGVVLVNTQFSPGDVCIFNARAYGLMGLTADAGNNGLGTNSVAVVNTWVESTSDYHTRTTETQYVARLGVTTVQDPDAVYGAPAKVPWNAIGGANTANHGTHRESHAARAVYYNCVTLNANSWASDDDNRSAQPAYRHAQGGSGADRFWSVSCNVIFGQGMTAGSPSQHKALDDFGAFSVAHILAIPRDRSDYVIASRYPMTTHNLLRVSGNIGATMHPQGDHQRIQGGSDDGQVFIDPSTADRRTRYLNGAFIFDENAPSRNATVFSRNVIQQTGIINDLTARAGTAPVAVGEQTVATFELKRAPANPGDAYFRVFLTTTGDFADATTQNTVQDADDEYVWGPDPLVWTRHAPTTANFTVTLQRRDGTPFPANSLIRVSHNCVRPDGTFYDNNLTEARGAREGEGHSCIYAVEGTWSGFKYRRSDAEFLPPAEFPRLSTFGTFSTALVPQAGSAAIDNADPLYCSLDFFCAPRGANPSVGPMEPGSVVPAGWSLPRTPSITAAWAEAEYAAGQTVDLDDVVVTVVDEGFPAYFGLTKAITVTRAGNPLPAASSYTLETGDTLTASVSWKQWQGPRRPSVALPSQLVGESVVPPLVIENTANREAAYVSLSGGPTVDTGVIWLAGRFELWRRTNPDNTSATVAILGNGGGVAIVSRINGHLQLQTASGTFTLISEAPEPTEVAVVARFDISASGTENAVRWWLKVGDAAVTTGNYSATVEKMKVNDVAGISFMGGGPTFLTDVVVRGGLGVWTGAGTGADFSTFFETNGNIKNWNDPTLGLSDLAAYHVFTSRAAFQSGTWIGTGTAPTVTVGGTFYAERTPIPETQAPTVTASDSLAGRTLTITVGSSAGIPSPTLSLTALTLDSVDVLADATGTGPWSYVVPSSGSAQTVAWTVTATNSAGSATSSGSEPVAADRPPHSAALFFDFTDPDTMSLSGSDILSATDKIGSVTATGIASRYPERIAADVSAGLPIRARFAGTDVLEIPTSYSFDRQASSYLVVSVPHAANTSGGAGAQPRGAFFVASASTIRSAVYRWDNSELRTWTGTSTAVGTGLRVSDGLTALTGAFGAASARVGSDLLTYTHSGALAADTSTGGRIGCWSGSSFPLSGDILAVVHWDKQLTTTEMNDALSWASSTFGTPSRDASIIFDGDSITQGVQDASPQITPHQRDYSYPAQCQRLFAARPRIVNTGIGGALLTNSLTAAAVSRIALGYEASSARRIVLGLWGTNDIANARTTAQITADIDSYITGLKSVDASVIVGMATILPRSGFTTGQNTIRTEVNAYIMDSVSGAALDFRVDVASAPNLTDPNNLTYYTDGIHPTTAGYAALAAAVYPTLLAELDAT